MKIVGTKFFMHDSAIAVLDFDKQEVFAISTERVTRIKHDWVNIQPVLTNYQSKLQGNVVLAHSFKTANLPFFVLKDKLNVLWREILQPRYIQDYKVSKFSKLLKLLQTLFWNPVLLFKYISAHIKFYALRFCRKLHLRCLAIDLREYIKQLFEQTGLNVTELQLVDHHVAHAASALPFMRSANEESLILTIDGEGDGHFSKLFLYKKGKTLRILWSNSPLSFRGTSRYVNLSNILISFCFTASLRGSQYVYGISLIKSNSFSCYFIFNVLCLQRGVQPAGTVLDGSDLFPLGQRK